MNNAELTEELRTDIREIENDSVNTLRLMWQAADLIEAQAKRIKELQQIADHHEQAAKDYWKEACDYKQRIAELEAQMPKEGEWISVEDRLPEDGTRNLVTRYDYVTDHKFYDLLWFDKGEWWNRQFVGNYAVTHWMPLPETPKGEQE